MKTLWKMSFKNWYSSCFPKGNIQQNLLYHLQACDAFSTAVKLYPRYADAFYERGLCRMQLQQEKCILDFNKVLAISPKHFQVILTI